MEIQSIDKILSANEYPGRGIIVGMTEDSKKAVCAYFIMGRSVNSRNRVFVAEGEEMRTKAYDESKLTDPSLIIYYPVRKIGNKLIVTNGDQTDTVRDFIAEGKTFEEALETRCFEPDAPNFTPRISAEMTFEGGAFKYKMSILKAADAEGSACNRYTYNFEPLAGAARFIHTYMENGDPASLLAEVDRAVHRDITVDGTFPMLRCCHYKNGDADVYMFVNESVTEEVHTKVSLDGIDSCGVMLDLLNDEICAVCADDGKLGLSLAPYQSVIVVFDDEDVSKYPAKKVYAVRKPAALTFGIETAYYTDLGKYEVFAQKVNADSLPNITDVDNMPEFSGTVRYTCKFDRPDGISAIDLGEVGQTAHLWCNDVDLGVRLCPPYRYDLTKALRDGENTLVIEVSNTLANAIRDGFSAYMAIPGSGIIGPVNWLG